MEEPMARKRMIDPEFWSDEKIASLSSDCKLLFIGLWNFADDEGIFKAHPSLLASQIFPYEEGVGKKIEKYLEELKTLNLVFCYALNGQRYGIILNFKRHQTISHPQPSQLPKPSIQSKEYRVMIYTRDNFTCAYCHNSLVLGDNTKFTKPTLDHILARSKGGSDLPENLITSCESCNKSKGTKDFEEFMELSGNDTGTFLPNIKEVNRIEQNRSEEKPRAKGKWEIFENLLNASDDELQPLVQSTQTNLAFIRSCIDSMGNWLEKNGHSGQYGKPYKNYMAALRDWSKNDAIKIRKEDHVQRTKASIITGLE